jgi:hypothetical protein
MAAMAGFGRFWPVLARFGRLLWGAHGERRGSEPRNTRNDAEVFASGADEFGAGMLKAMRVGRGEFTDHNRFGAAGANPPCLVTRLARLACRAETGLPSRRGGARVPDSRTGNCGWFGSGCKWNGEAGGSRTSMVGRAAPVAWAAAGRGGSLLSNSEALAEIEQEPGEGAERGGRFRLEPQADIRPRDRPAGPPGASALPAAGAPAASGPHSRAASPPAASLPAPSSRENARSAAPGRSRPAPSGWNHASGASPPASGPAA